MAKSKEKELKTEEEQGEVVANSPHAVGKNPARDPNFDPEAPVPEEAIEDGTISPRDAALGVTPKVESGEIDQAKASETSPQKTGEALTSNKKAERAKKMEIARAQQADRDAVNDDGVSIGRSNLPKENKADKVLITLAVDIPKTKIGGQWYSFWRDKTYRVPKNVKRVLMKRPGLLKPTL